MFKITNLPLSSEAAPRYVSTIIMLTPTAGALSDF